MAANDPSFGSVASLIHGDGANDGTTFADITGKTVTRNGNVVTKTGTKKFGTASCYFDGTSDSLSLATHTTLDLTGDFTIECWVYCSDLSANRGVYYQGDGTDNNRLQVSIYSDGSITGFARTITDNPNFNAASTAGIISAATWHHVAFVKNGTDVRVYVDGADVANATSVGTLPSGYAVHWGKSRTGTADRWMLGYIDDMRITKGVARYTSAFTPPAAAYPDYGRYVAGTITETTDHTDWTVRTYRLDSGALLNEVTAVGSTYEAPCCPVATHTDYAGPVMIACHQKSGSAWSANTVKVSGDYAVPVDPVATPYVFKCTTGGTTHSTTEPTWDTTPGNTTADGTVTWTCQGHLVQPLLQGPLIPSI